MPRHLLPIPHHKQTKESDCLATCAWMALEAIGENIPYSKLLTALDIKPWGTPHRNIRELEGLAHNIHVVYRQGELPDLFAAIEVGFAPLVFIWTGELSYWSTATWHAVLIVGYDDEHFYVNDPHLKTPRSRSARETWIWLGWLTTRFMRSSNVRNSLRQRIQRKRRNVSPVEFQHVCHGGEFAGVV